MKKPTFPPTPRALVGNMADEEQVKVAGEKELSALDQERASWLAVLDSYEGRHVLWRIMNESGAFKSVMPVFSPIDPLRLAVNAGRQEVGLFIKTCVELVAPTALSVMQQDHTHREASNA